MRSLRKLNRLMNEESEINSHSLVLRLIVEDFLEGSATINVTEYLRSNKRGTMVARFVPNRKVYLVANFVVDGEDLGLEDLIIYFGNKYAVPVEELGLSEYDEEAFIEDVIKMAYGRHFYKD